VEDEQSSDHGGGGDGGGCGGGDGPVGGDPFGEPVYSPPGTPSSSGESSDIDDKVIRLAFVRAHGIVYFPSDSDGGSEPGGGAAGPGDPPPSPPRPPLAPPEPGPLPGVPVPLAPFPSAMGSVRDPGLRARAEIEVRVPGGRLVYYRRFGRVAAKCGVHVDCSVSRTLTASPLPSRAGQGRPLAFLLAWLDAGSDETAYPDRNAHVHICSPCLEIRQRARAAYAADPDVGPFFPLEREQRPGEPDEPPHVPC
jgi:hypothetical protein